MKTFFIFPTAALFVAAICFAASAQAQPTLAQLFAHPAGQITAQVFSCYPPQNYTRFAGDSLTITFAPGTPIVAASLTDSTFVVQAQQSGWHQGVATYDQATNTITFKPAKPFFAGELVTAVATWKVLYDSAGIAVPIHGFAWQFYAAVAKHTRATFRNTVHLNPGGPTILSGLADVDETGNLDILYEHAPADVIAYNSGNGVNFQNTTLNIAGDMFPADYKLRGLMDVVVGFDSCSLDSNKGDRTFIYGRIQPFNSPADAKALTCLDYSGIPEITTEGYDKNTGSTEDTIIIYAVASDSIIRRQAMYVGPIGLGPLVVADFNNDGALDVGTYINGSLSIMYNDGTGKLLPPVSVLPGGAGELAADLDGDGLVDWIGMTGQGVEIDRNNGDGTFTPIESPDRFNAERTGLAIGDCDGDGQLDVVYSVDVWPQQFDSMFLVTAKNVGNDKMHITQEIFEGTGLGELTDIYLGDLHHWGALDVAVSYFDAGAIYLFENDSSIAPIDVVEKPATTPDGFALNQSYPNPSSLVTTISYTLPVSQKTNIAIFSETGQFVATIVNGLVDAGSYKVTYDCSNLTSGNYYVRLLTPLATLTKSFTVVH